MGPFYIRRKDVLAKDPERISMLYYPLHVKLDLEPSTIAVV